MNTITRQEYKNQKRAFDLMGFNYIDHRDKRIINYVSRSLKGINTGAFVSSGTISYTDALVGSLDYVKVLGTEVHSKVSSFVNTLSLKEMNPVNNGYTCFVTYSYDPDAKKVNETSGNVGHYKVPLNPDSMASIHLGHEHIHAMKETNYEEYKDGQVLGDVITMLYEFILADTHPELKKDIYRFRLSTLKEDFKHYENAVAQMQKSKQDKDLYKIIATRSGQYLNSYYYAVILFNLYKDNPDVILELVNKVLNHEMTTREMLESLNLLYQLNDVVYDNELNLVKSSIKKV